MSDLSPQCAAKRTLAGGCRPIRFMSARPNTPALNWIDADAAGEAPTSAEAAMVAGCSDQKVRRRAAEAMIGVHFSS
jgi:hypothetical protein